MHTQTQTASVLTKPSILPRVRKSEVLLWTLISAAYTAIIIQYSLRYGKLAAPPYYDDVSYFVDALPRLQEFYAHNWVVVCFGLVYRAPHSLFSTILAVAGYLICGTGDWAPYAANGVIILALAAFLNFLAQGVSLGMRLLIFSIVATTPVCLYAVYDFRPDIASGMVTAAAAMLLLTQPLSAATWQRRVLAGGLFGLSMVMKTPTFPLTMGLMLVALSVSTITDIFVNGRQQRRDFSKLWAQSIVAALAIVLPVYVFNLKVIFSYIYEPIFGSTSAMWATHLSLWNHIFFYLTGSFGGGQFLGWHLYLFFLILVAGLIVIVRNRDFRLLVLFGGMFVVTLAAYIVVTLMHVKQRFFGSTFDWMLIFTCAQLLIWLGRRGTLKQRAIGIGLAATAALVTLQPIPRMYTPEGGNLLARRRVIYAIEDAINAQHPNTRDRIFITTTGFVNSHLLKYLNLQKGLPELNVGDLAFSDNLAMYKSEIARAQFVVASEPGNSEAFTDFIASGSVQAQTLALTRRDTDLAEIAAIPTETPARYFVFQRVGPGYGFEPIEGLKPIEGPFPKWKVGYVRWGLGPRSVMMTPPVPKAGHYHLVAEARGITGQHMDFIIDDTFRYTQIFGNSTDFMPLDLALDLTPGRHKVEFDYSTWRTPENDLPMAVLFRTLKLLPDAATTQPTR